MVIMLWFKFYVKSKLKHKLTSDQTWEESVPAKSAKGNEAIFFSIRVIGNRNSLPQSIEETPSMKVFESRLD